MGTYFILIGVQGAGKGTQAKFISEDLGIPHISTGDLFRAMRDREDDLAKEVQSLMKEGKLIPDSVTNKMVEDRLAQADARNGAILDGYPRNAQQAEFLQSILKENDHISVILLELDRETAFKRAEGRRYSPDMNRDYNVYFNPPKTEGVDDISGEPLIQRKDDHPKAVNKRIDLYYENTQPLIDYFDDKGLLIRIDADQSIEKVRADIKSAIKVRLP
jgi:adenylate kinase